MAGRSTPPAGSRRDHPIRNVQPKEHDPYHAHRKSDEAMVCDDCGVVFHGGKWYWGTAPLCNEKGGRCPACQRIHDRYPAGTI
ncbi:MAG: BCAM0308 family protein, partial [Planctomycetota bacterium]